MITKEKQQLLDYYNKGLAFYKQRKWNDSIECFKNALQIDSNDGPSQLYLERANTFLKNPPGEDWDGVFVMTTK